MHRTVLPFGNCFFFSRKSPSTLLLRVGSRKSQSTRSLGFVRADYASTPRCHQPLGRFTQFKSQEFVKIYHAPP